MVNIIHNLARFLSLWVWFFFFGIVLFIIGVWNHNFLLIGASSFFLLCGVLGLIYYISKKSPVYEVTILPKNIDTPEKEPLTKARLDSSQIKYLETLFSSKIFLFILFILAAFTIQYWGEPLGHSSGVGLNKLGTSFWSGFTGKTNPKKIPVVAYTQKNSNFHEFDIPPGEKVGLVKMPNKSFFITASTGLFFNPAGGSEIIYFPSPAEYQATHQRGVVPPGNSYVFTDAVDTVHVLITW